ncbi:MAG: hypothetical protein LRY71_00700 [Bacillaceae bacterium]|nr:hypothetical protein [Bacillaceae bacterium]
MRDNHLNTYSAEIEELRKKNDCYCSCIWDRSPESLCFSQQLDERHNQLLKERTKK